MTGRLKSESGFALILTLVVTALMVAVVVEMIHQVYVDTSLSRGFRDGQQASILAESGATGGAKLLQMSLLNQKYTSLSDQWATPFKIDDEVGSLEITINEESGKININSLVQEKGENEPFTMAALKRLGTRLKIQEDVWGAVADWLDSNDLPQSGGVESPYYQTLKPPYNARNGKLMTLTELSLVKGVTPEIFGKLRPYLTIFSDTPNSSININTASEEVLTALDERITPSVAKRIDEERRIQPFKLQGELSRVPELYAVANDSRNIGRIAIVGTLFRLTSVARVKESVRTVEMVVRLTGGTPQILSWQEY